MNLRKLSIFIPNVLFNEQDCTLQELKIKVIQQFKKLAEIECDKTIKTFGNQDFVETKVSQINICFAHLVSFKSKFYKTVDDGFDFIDDLDVTIDFGFADLTKFFT